MINLSGLANAKLVGAALIVVGSCLGIGHIISVARGVEIRISKDGYSAQPRKKSNNIAVNKNELCEE